MNVPAFSALVRKDLRLFFGDQRALLLSFAAPIAVASFFGFLFGGQSGKTEASPIDIRVVDEDGSETSKQIVDSLALDKAIAMKPASKADARETVAKGKAVVAVLIPRGFGDAAAKAFFSTGQKPQVELLYDPSHSAELAMIRGILTEHVMQAVSKDVFSPTGGRRNLQHWLASVDQDETLNPEDKGALRDMLKSVDRWFAQTENKSEMRGVGGLKMPYDVKEEPVTAGGQIKYNGYAHSFGGMGIQFMLFMAIDAGIAVLTQRARGFWKRYRAAPLSKSTLLAARALSTGLIAFLILVAGFAFARIVFGVRITGSFVGFLGICVASSLMASSFGLMIAALGKTPEATRGLAIFATLIMVMLGGAWVPAFLFPSWLQKLTLFIPTRWAVDGLDAMTWRGLGVADAVGPMAALVAFALLFSGLAVARFRWDG